MEMLGDWLRHCNRLAYIDTGFGSFAAYQKATHREAQERGWDYERLHGSTILLQRLLDGDWDPEDFLVMLPNTPIRVPTTRPLPAATRPLSVFVSGTQ